LDKKESYSKIPGENMIKFIISPWKNEFINAISQVQKELIISSPFINIQGVEVISNVIPNSDNVELSLITNLTIGNIRNRGVDPSALLGLWDRFENLKQRIKNEHGCEVIVNGIIPSIKYYLRLIKTPSQFMEAYTINLKEDREVKEEHLKVWLDVIKAIRNPP